MMDRFWSFSWLNVSLKFLVVTSIAIAIVFTGFFFWLWKNQENQIMEQVRKQATILRQQIALTREWVAAQDSLTRKRGRGKPSDHFRSQSDVEGPDGSLLTKISPVNFNYRTLGTCRAKRPLLFQAYQSQLSESEKCPRRSRKDSDSNVQGNFRKRNVST